MREMDKDIMRDVLDVLYASFEEDGPGGDVVDDTELISSLEYADDDIDYVLRRMDGSQMVNFQRYGGSFRVQLRPRGVDKLDADQDTIASNDMLERVYDRIYEADRRTERLTYSELERLVGSADELDKYLWYLDNKGYVETARQYRVPHITELGRRNYERD